MPCTRPPPPPARAPHPWHPPAPPASCGDGEAPAGGSTEASPSARFKSSQSPARRANEATRHLLYLFPLPSSRLGTVTRAHSPLVGSQSRGSVTLCRKLAPIPGRTLLPGSRSLPPPPPPAPSPPLPHPSCPLGPSRVPQNTTRAPAPPPPLARLVGREANRGAADRRRAPAEPHAPTALAHIPFKDDLGKTENNNFLLRLPKTPVSTQGLGSAARRGELGGGLGVCRH